MQRRFCLPSLLLVAALATKAGHAQIKTYGAAAKPDRAANVAWRMDGNGHFPGVRPLVDWSADRNILWKTRVEIGGFSSPIVVGNKVFVTAEMGSLLRLDLADGKILWQKDLFSKDSQDIPADLSTKLMRGSGGDSKQSTPTPASNGELVFYVNAMGLCACYDLQGNRKWIRIIETAQDEEHFTSSPIFVGDQIILSWGCLLALNAKDGTTRWKAADAKPTHGTSACQDRRRGVVITPGGDVVRLVDGEILCSGLFESRYTTPLIEGNVLYVIDAEARVLELPARAEKGMRLKELWKTKLGGIIMASPFTKTASFIPSRTRSAGCTSSTRKPAKFLRSAVSWMRRPRPRKGASGVKIEGLVPAQVCLCQPGCDRTGMSSSSTTPATRPCSSFGPEYKSVRVNKLEDGLAERPSSSRTKLSSAARRPFIASERNTNGAESQADL